MTARVDPWNVTPEAAQHIRPLEVQTEELPDDSDDLVLPIVPLSASVHVTASADDVWADSYKTPSRLTWWLFVIVCIGIPALALACMVALLLVTRFPDANWAGIILYLCASAGTAAGLVWVFKWWSGRR